MDLAPVIEALQATLVPQLRQQAEEKLAQVSYSIPRFYVGKFLILVL